MMNIPGDDAEVEKAKLIQHQKKQVWITTLAMIAGGCLITAVLLSVIYFLFKSVLGF
jgi:hypothetical protein